ncbi:hypothetical protein P2Q76_18030, partial [Escherichia coli]
MTEEQKRIERAIELACRYGGTDEMHHLQWVVDQMVRELAGERYALMNPLMILVKIIKLRWIHILSYDQ